MKTITNILALIFGSVLLIGVGGCDGKRSAGPSGTTWIGSNPESGGEDDIFLLTLADEKIHVGRPVGGNVTVYGECDAVTWASSGLAAAGVDIEIENITRRGESDTLRRYVTTDCGGFNLNGAEPAETFNLRAEQTDLIEVRAAEATIRRRVVETFTAGVGLTTAVALENESTVWFGTDSGALRCQSVEVVGTEIVCAELTRFTLENTAAVLGSNYITAMAAGGGEVWAGTLSSLGVYRNGIWMSVTADLPYPRVDVMAAGTGGEIWIGTPGDITRYENGIFKTFTAQDGYSAGALGTISVGPSGDVWVGGVQGINVFKNGRFETVTSPISENWVNPVQAIGITPAGDAWYATAYLGVVEVQNGIATAHTASNGLTDSYGNAIATTRTGDVWVATGSGVSLFQNGSWTTFTQADGLPNSHVNTVTADEGGVWVGTSDGPARYKDGQWAAFSRTNGLVSDVIDSMAVGSDGEVWFGSLKGASRYQNGTWRTFTTADGLASDYITRIAVGTNGDVWFGTAQGVTRYQDEEWQTFTTADGLADNFIYALAAAANGDIWIGTAKGVGRYHGEAWTIVTKADGLVDDWIFTIAAGGDGDIWIGTANGVSRYSGGAWTSYILADGMGIANVMAIGIGKVGDVWIGTLDGTFRYQDDIWAFLGNRITGGFLLGMAAVDENDIWFLSGQRLRHYKDGRSALVTTKDGLLSSTVHSIVRGADGSIFVGTANGVTRFYEVTDDVVIEAIKTNY